MGLFWVDNFHRLVAQATIEMHYVRLHSDRLGGMSDEEWCAGFG